MELGSVLPAPPNQHSANTLSVSVCVCLSVFLIHTHSFLPYVYLRRKREYFHVVLSASFQCGMLNVATWKLIACFAVI